MDCLCSWRLLLFRPEEWSSWCCWLLTESGRSNREQLLQGQLPDVEIIGTFNTQVEVLVQGDLREKNLDQAPEALDDQDSLMTFSISSCVS